MNKKLWIKKNSNLKNITALCKWNTVNKMKPTRVIPAAQPFEARDTRDRFPDNALLKSWSFSHAKFIELQILTDGLCVMCKP